MTVVSYITEKPVRVYVIASPTSGRHEVEADYLWDAINALKHEQQYLDANGNGYGSRDVEHDVGELLVGIGVMKYGIRYWGVPTENFDAFYDEMVESLNDRLPADDEPGFIWKLEEQT